LVEIDKQPGYPLGIRLTEAMYKNKPVLCISGVSPASVADRSVIDSFLYLMIIMWCTIFKFIVVKHKQNKGVHCT